MNDKTRNKVLLVLFLGVLMGGLEIAIVAPALPSIQNFFGIETVHLHGRSRFMFYSI